MIELIVMLALLGTILVLYFGRASVHSQKKQQALCRQNLKAIHMALQIYARDHEERYPSLAGAKYSEEPLDLLFPKYTANRHIFICPGSRGRPRPSGEKLAGSRMSYSYLMGLAATAAPEQWLMGDPLARQDPETGLVYATTGDGVVTDHERYGGVVLFVDGRTETTEPKTEFPITQPPGTRLLNPAK